MSPALPFYALCLLWAASELWLSIRKRSGDAARARDAGTLRLLLLTVCASIAIAVWIAALGIARFPHHAAHALLWTGCAMMAIGIALRWWAIRALARWFTVDVTIRPGHQLIRSGPYRWLRHPSYSGALLTLYGFAIAFGNALSLAIVIVPVTLAFLWRMRIEERVLSEAFPEAYAAYARDTKRLLPYLW
ncbi:MAG: methyltransferase family protein [Luteimonas sp.]